ncbi:tyrosine-type recombinase/integrase [Brachybacterium sp. 107]|uniref:tyrosine-type recombinase/integrase n=1 Tax=Brachybacterium sp. 107 TaxID=3457736 RepID=UPI004033D107
MASISVRPRKDGTTAYRVAFRITRGGTPTTETFDNHREAAAFSALVDRIGGPAARAKRIALEHGGPVRPALAEVLDDYIAAAPDITAGTAAEYKRILVRSGLTDQLGALPVDLIDRTDIERWVQARAVTPSVKTKRPVSAKTIRNEHGLLSALLEHAQDRDWVDGNACDGVRLPAREHHDIRILTQAELGTILETISDLYRPLVLLLAATGLRWGEATALTWADVNSDSCTFTVRRAWKHDETHQRILGAPKTRRAHRTIETTPKIIAALGARGKPGALVFTNRAGRPIQHQTFFEYHWKKATKKITPRPRVHDLRHFAASHMLVSGADLFEVSRALGHESLKTTSDVYGHLVPSRTRPTVTHATMLEALIPGPRAAA